MAIGRLVLLLTVKKRQTFISYSLEISLELTKKMERFIS